MFNGPPNTLQVISGTGFVFTGQKTQSRLNVFGGLGPLGWWGPYHFYGQRGGVGAVVLCTSESGNIHLGPNQSQTWCQITIYEMGHNLL